MKTIVKRTVTFCLAVAMLAGIAGCGKTKNADQADKITLRLWSKQTQDALPEDVEYHDAYMAVLKEKFPDIIFEEAIMPQGGDYRQEYDKALMAGKEPAFIAMFSYTDIPTRSKNGTVADITKYVENWDLRKEGKVLDIFDEAISSDGKWYAIPWKAYTQASLVNKKVLAEAGWDENNIPKTWKEFAEMGEKVTDFSIPRIGYALVGYDYCAWPFTAWVWSAGGEMVRKNADGTYKLAFNEPEGVDTALFMNEMIWKHKMTQKDALMNNADLTALQQNNTAVFSWGTFGTINDKAVEKYGVNPQDFAVAPIPVKEEGIQAPALAGGEVITFSPKLTEKELEAAVEVAKYLYYSDEMMQLEFDYIKKNEKMNVYIPGRVDLYEQKLQANVRLNEDMIENMLALRDVSRPEPYCPHWTDIKTALVEPLQRIYLTDGISREEVQNILDECADNLYGLYPDSFKK